MELRKHQGVLGTESRRRSPFAGRSPLAAFWAIVPPRPWRMDGLGSRESGAAKIVMNFFQPMFCRAKSQLISLSSTALT